MSLSRVSLKLASGAFALAMLTSFTAAPVHAASNEYVRVAGVATGDFLNIRNGPDVASPIIGRIPPTARGIALRASGIGKWVLVRYNGVVGWAHSRYLKPEIAEGSIAPLEAMRAGHYGVVGIKGFDVLNVRAFPSARSRKVAAIPPHARGIRVDRRHPNGWALVSYGPARGWVNMRYLAPASASAGR
ncbi:MAG: SH3 domain-containing protein [Pseudomonadota bacterium]